MKTEILISALFFLLGLVIGAVTTGILIYKYLRSESYYEEELEQEPLIKKLSADELPPEIKNIFEKMTKKQILEL